ncbi:uncharacterized protein [Rutidosis leptorrhynchoides]|uniref:uncharacterized protein n=1 Tax=Rutidosis leptorrhynchoides TaxID=125765 RepID=UPI003A998A2F
MSGSRNSLQQHEEQQSDTVSTDGSSLSGRASFETTLNAESNQFDELECNEVEIIDKNGNIIRKQTMTTKDVTKLKTGEKVLVHLNGFDQPIRSAGSLCTRYMGNLLKQQRFCPIEAKDWREVKRRCGVILMEDIRGKFSLPERENVDRVLLLILGDKYRARKYNVKDKLFKSVIEKLKLREADNIGIDDAQEIQYTEEQILEGLDLVDKPADVTDYQWNKYKDYLRSSELKNLSKLGKKARGEKLHAHTTGARSHARIRDEFMLKYNREPYPLEFFDIVYKTKEGSYVKDVSKDFVDMANKQVKKKILNLDDSECVDSHKRSKIEREVVMELIGPDKPGRARLHGKGVTKSQVTDVSYDLRRTRGESSTNNNVNVGTLLVLLESQRQQIESQNKQIQAQNKQIEAQNKKIQFQNQKIESRDKQIMCLHQILDDLREEFRKIQSLFQDSYFSRENPSSRASHEE